jgi:hypothetical protein
MHKNKNFNRCVLREFILKILYYTFFFLISQDIVLYFREETSYGFDYQLKSLGS